MTQASPQCLSAVGVFALALGAGLACQPRPDLIYETEHLQIGTDFDGPLCQGDLDRMEQVITTVEGVLGVQLDGPLEVYLWAIEDWPPEPSTCSTDVSIGCLKGKRIYASMLALHHELVHAVVHELGSPKSFWDEGAAMALERDRVRLGTLPSDNLDLRPPELDYQAAGHFSRYLLETYGPDLYRELLRAKGSAREAFESTYGMSVEQAQDEYLAEAPYAYAPLTTCNYPDLAAVGDQQWSETIDLDCDDPETFGGPYGMGGYRVFTVEERGLYTISTSAAVAVIAQCADEHLDTMPVDGDPELGDVPPMTAAAPLRFARALPGNGELTTLDLAPGRYELELSFPAHEPAMATLDVVGEP